MALCFCDVEAYYLNMHPFIPPIKHWQRESVVTVPHDPPCNGFSQLLILLQKIQQLVKTPRNISFSVLLIKCVSDEPTEPTHLVVPHLKCHHSLIYGITGIEKEREAHLPLGR